MTPSETLVLVTGATGRQGGAVARHLLDGGFRVRALTRDPEKAGAKRLSERGAEIARGDLDDRASLEKGIAGCHGVFSVQNYWEKGVGYEGEVRQGRQLADVAKAAGVGHFVQSSICIHPGGEAAAPEHFRSKFVIEDHIRSIDLPATMVRTVMFAENFTDPQYGRMMVPILRGSLADDVPMHLVVVDDIGRMVRRVCEDPARYLGRTVDVVSEILTIGQITAAWERASGKKRPWWKMPHFLLRLIGGEMAAQFRWNRDVRWRVTMDEVHRELPETASVEAYLREALPKE
jgi:uncharacterized protein YbjT (DUF2867 family)